MWEPEEFERLRKDMAKQVIPAEKRKYRYSYTHYNREPQSVCPMVAEKAAFIYVIIVRYSIYHNEA